MKVKTILELDDGWGIERYGKISGRDPSIIGLRHYCNEEWHMATSISMHNKRICCRCSIVAPPEVVGYFKFCCWSNNDY